MNISCNISQDYSERLNNSLPESPIVPLSYYAYGNVNPGHLSMKNLKSSFYKAYKDYSNDIFERNALSINTKKYQNKALENSQLKVVDQVSKNQNNYLDPRYHYKMNEDLDFTPKINSFAGGSYIAKKEKIFCEESKDSPVNKSPMKGKFVNKEHFYKLKRNLSCSDIPEKETNFPQIEIKKRNLYESKNSFSISPNNNNLYPNFLENSKGVPHWMNISSKRKQKENLILAYNKKETEKDKAFFIFSKFKGWIQGESNNIRRDKPKSFLDPEWNYKKRPKWMNSKFSNNKYIDKVSDKKNDIFKAIPYKCFKDKNRERIYFIDKKNIYNPDKSIFSLQDYRQDAMTLAQHKENIKNISMLPKKFFH